MRAIVNDYAGAYGSSGDLRKGKTHGLTLARTLCLLISLNFLIFLTWPAQALAWSGSVISVYDGDTLRVRNASGGNVAVRLYGLDAPEMENEDWPEQPYARQARDRLRELLPRGARVEVRVDQDTTSYGRTVATLILQDGREVNAILLEEGRVWFSDRNCRKPFCGEWRRNADRARRAGRGLWADDEALPPWIWKYRD